MTARSLLSELSPPILRRAVKALLSIADGGPRGAGSPRLRVVGQGPLRERKMWLDETIRWQRSMADGSYDREVLDYASTLRLEGATAIDIGAFMGYYTLAFASLVGPGGRVVAFEPNPVSRERLARNLSANPELAGRISVESACVGEANGFARFSLSDGVDSGTASGSHVSGTITPEKEEVYVSAGFREIRAEAVTLDRFVTRAGITPTLLKIDVEGAEASVLKGALATLDAFKPTILLEVHTPVAMFEVGRLLPRRGYELSPLKFEQDGRVFLAAKPG